MEKGEGIAHSCVTKISSEKSHRVSSAFFSAFPLQCFSLKSLQRFHWQIITLNRNENSLVLLFLFKFPKASWYHRLLSWQKKGQQESEFSLGKFPDPRQRQQRAVRIHFCHKNRRGRLNTYQLVFTNRLLWRIIETFQLKVGMLY